MGGARNDPGDDRRADAEVFNRFASIVRDRLAALADSPQQNSPDGGSVIDRLYKSPEFDAEKRVLNELNGLGLRQGVLAAAGCFAFLRISPRMISNYLRRRAGVPPAGSGGEGASATARNPFRRGSYEFDKPLSGTAVAPERPGLLFRAIRFGLDTFVSLSIGAYASIAFVDKNEMMRKFAEIPLVQGRSLLSEELCADFAEEFRRTPPGVWDRSGDSDGVGGEFDFRRTIRGFVTNCRRREVCEAELREEHGLGRREAVSVPAPGVPRVDVSLDDLLLDASGSDESDEGSGGGGDYFEEYFGAEDNDQVTK